MNESFEQWLERELNRSLAPVSGEHARPGQARYQAVATARAARRRVSPKLVVAVAVAAMALAGGGMVAVASASLNPQQWGQQVRSAVEQCKADLQPGQHGIGACVSGFAKQHGQQMPSQPGASGAAHAKNHPGPPWLRPQSSPTASPTTTP